MKPEHTPLQITREDSLLGDDYIYIDNKDGETLAECREIEHAEYIVTACNAYPKLVEALQAVEWEDVGGSLFVGKRCPFCEAYYENEDAGYATPQHKEDCIRQKALDKGSG